MKTNLIHKLLSLGVQLKVVDGHLRVNAPKGVLTEGMLEEIRQHKAYLVNLIASHTPIPKAPELLSYPVTPAQLSLWTLGQFEGGAEAYAIVNVWELKGFPDIAVLNRSINCLIERHEILRTVFKTDDYGKLHQHILPAERVSCSITVHEILDENDVPLYINSHLHHHFNTEEAPLLKVEMIKVNDEHHFLVFTLHHLVGDGWSMEILCREVVMQYNIIKQRTAAALPALPVQFKDYAYWYYSEEHQKKIEASAGYWQNQFSGPLPLLDIAPATVRPKIKTLNGNALVHTFPPYFTAQLKDFVKQCDASLFMGLMAGLNGIFYRYSGQTDIILGTLVAGREHADLEHQIGLFINTLAIRTRFEETDTFMGLLEKQKEVLLNGFAHQHYPFDTLVGNLSLKRDTSRSALFDVMVVLHNQNDVFEGEETFAGITVNPYTNYSRNNSLFDLKFSFVEKNEELSVTVTYNTVLYTRSFVENLVRNAEAFITEGIRNTREHIAAIDFLPQDEKNLIVNTFNATLTEYPSDKTIIDLFTEQVEKAPGNTAVVFEHRELTYGELNEQSARLSNYLITNYDVQPNDLVGIKLERSEKMILAILGVLRSGGAYVPLDTNYPGERLAYIKTDSNYKVCIDETFLETFDKEKNNFKPTIEGINISGTNTAYAIYTSGSTGNPKGVLNEHAGLYNRLLWMRDDLGINASDVILQKTPYTFDVSVWELLMPSITGCKLVFAEPEGHKDPAYLQNTIQNNNITIIHFVPSMLGIFLEELEPEKCKSLRHVVCSGEALPAVMVEEFKQKLPWVRIHNLYGPTEAAIDVTSIDLTEVDTKEHGVTIGKPVANTRIYIVDKQMSLQPIGVPGELLIEGIQVARGYLNRPELTAEKFIESPFTKGDRIYRTGDLAKWLPDGSIAYIGRMDNQVKIRGNRIELGEIEHAIAQYSETVKQVAVEAKEIKGDKVLVAYYVSETPLNKEGLRNYLQEKLPAYMVPGYYVAMDSMPLSPNGKIDRKQLPGISGEDIIRREYVAPVNELEEQLVAIWQEVLGVDRIGVTDDFFELGGHSLIVAQVINRIYRQLGKITTFKTFFANPTIAQLSLQLGEEKYEAIPRAPEAASYPLTAAQNRLWLLSQFEGGSLAYNIPVAVKLKGVVDMAMFERSFQSLIERHEILRTYFKTNEEGVVHQYIKPVSEIGFSIIDKDCSSAPGELATGLRQIHDQPFDLETAPLLRASMFKVNKNEFVFCVSLHHIISDGWSVELMISEIIKTYNDFIRGGVAGFRPLNIQYKDYALWLNTELQREKHQAAAKYWQQQLSGELPVLQLPAFKPRPSVQTYNGQTITHRFSQTFTHRLHQFSRQQGVTLFMTLMAGIKSLLRRYSGQNDIIIGTPISGRPHPELEHQLGLYLNTLAIRTGFGETNSFLEILKKTKDTLLEGYQHQHYPFDELIGMLNVKRDTSRSALFDVMMVLQSQAQLKNFGNGELSGLEVSSYTFEHTSSKFDITYTFAETETLQLSINYNTDIYDLLLIKRMFVHFEELMLRVMENPTLDIETISYISREEKYQLLESFNATLTEYPSDKTIISLFEEQVEKAPGNIAVVFEHRELSYSELNEQSARLANYLITNYHVQPNDLVGIKLERSERMLLAILGVLRSGGAYVPLDTNYPEDRLTYIQSDSNYKVCIDETFLEAFDKEKNNFKPTIEGINISGTNTAYAIYTSGSTGNPKGVLNEHAGLYNRLLWMRDDLGINASDVILQKTPYTFDVSVWELLMPSITGCKLVFAEPEGHKDPAYLQNTIQNNGITIIHFVPSMLGIFLEELEPEKCKSLRHVVCSGEALPAVMVEEFKQKLPWVRIHNLYGPTEAAIDVTSIDLTEVDTKEHGVTIGKPVANTRIYIVDKYMSLQPVGVPGELLIEGIQVARGYLNRPELTAEKFIESPFTKGDRIYRTGDLAKWLPDGSIAYIGRMDNQVKIRGNRIELGEIEHAIAQYSEIVKQVAVEAKEIKGDKVLVAYYVSETPLNKEGLRNYLQEKLPAYMVPGYYVAMDSLPLSTNGKVDRKQLPGISGEDIIRREYVAPVNELEEQLVAIWQEVLGVDRIGVTDDFFELGGHSLNAVKILAQVHRQFDVSIKIQELFTRPTIKNLALNIENAQWMGEMPAQQPVKKMLI